MRDDDIALKVDAVSKSFGGVRAVRDVSLEVARGERISMIGTNGAGKSTVFNLIAGVFPVSSGRIELFGENLTHLSTAKRAGRGLARTFQTSRLFEQLTAAENVFVALGRSEFRGRSLRPARYSSARWERVSQLLERVGLSGKGAAVVADLSHGEQRQLELAMALSLQPKLLMLDEPAAGFSPVERQHLVTLLRDIPEEISLLLIEHDMDIALAVASRVIVMHDGEKILEGTPEDIRSSERVREIYLGGSVDNAA
ncbi:ABC transporter ATP-binding protein [Paramicrobacterium fandaimingii]|uniref:ABC transporter ATP-binding protein n=1 Tax=Paramicrobacterium fandaimingii TaxID=2708079 RepID=UPI00141E4AA1|nr:ABC transporter ATP-binding protein [Microbacterium fandaimingii]